MKAAIVLRLMDAAAKEPAVRGTIAIEVRQRAEVVWKGPGCAVILDKAGEGGLEIMLHSPIYQAVQLRTSLEGTLPRDVYLWLQPSVRYPFSDDMAVISGTYAADRMYAVRKAAGCRLLRTTAAGDRHLEIWGMEGLWEGRTILLCEGAQRELVTLAGQTGGDMHHHQVKGQIQKAFSKESTRIFTADRLCPDEQGSFVTAYRDIRDMGERVWLLDGSGAASSLVIQKGGRYAMAGAQPLTCSGAGIPWD